MSKLYDYIQCSNCGKYKVQVDEGYQLVLNGRQIEEDSEKEGMWVQYTEEGEPQFSFEKTPQSVERWKVIGVHS